MTLKILIASLGKPSDQTTWSGTAKTLYELLSNEKYYKVSEIDLWQFVSKWRLKIYLKLSRYIFTWGITRNPFLYPLYKDKVNLYFRKIVSKPDWVLFISEHCLDKKKDENIKYAVYIDAELAMIAPYLNEHKFTKKYFCKYYYHQTQSSYLNMDVIFTQNEWTKQALIEFHGIDAGKVFNIGFGVNLQPFKGEKDYSKELLLIVLRKGTEEYKGLNLLLDAFCLLKVKRPNVQLAVVGTDVGQDIEGVTCYYNQPREVTVELFKESTLYVMPALREPNGITYLEGLVNKTPIVGLERFAFPEFSGNGKWGFICKNEDPIELADLLDSALSDKIKLKEMGIQGQNFVLSHYSWGKVIKRITQYMHI